MILVTGGAGFIGSVLIKRLNMAGREDILIVDRLRDSSKWKNLPGLKYSTYLHSDDFFEEKSNGIVSGISFIFHIGACSDTTETDMDFLMKNNVDYSKKLFNIARREKIPFVYASSAATYGDGSLGYSDSHELVDKLLPINRYGYSKQLFDQWVLKQDGIDNMLWFGLKFFNVFGPNEYHKGKMRSIVLKAFEQINENGKVNLFKSHRDDFGDGEQLRDFVYVMDVVNLMEKFMGLYDPCKSGIYNIGTGTERSFNHLVASVFSALNRDILIEYIDMPENLKGQYQYYTKAEMKKIKNLFPDFKFRSLEEGVSDYVNGYLRHGT